MPISIEFNAAFMSIESFPPTTLPDFTLITGLNGCGKTHFLQALTSGHLRIQEISAPGQEVRYLDWNSMVPKSQGEFNGQTLANERKQLIEQLKSTISESRKRISNNLRGSLSNALPWKLENLVGIEESQAAELLLENVGPGNASQRVRQLIQLQMQKERTRMFRNAQQRAMIERLETALQKPYLFITDKELEAEVPIQWGQTDLFEQSFARVFVAYRDALVQNDLKELRASKGDKDTKFLSKDQFISTYGVPPWDFLNQIMQSAGLDFEVDSPTLDFYGSYSPTLTKISSEKTVPFNGLSSGEKVLMSFATCLYYAVDQRQTVTFPKILLLDEVDAPLHPSMSKTLIDAITKTLVDDFNIKVICTTHSPSTVAVTEEEFVYVMDRQNPGVHKASKGQAISLLTYGVPTLSLNFEGQRQVFVESKTDAQVYDLTYRAAKPFLKSERSLSFIQTGVRMPSGDIGTGCSQVKRFANEFRESGNSSVFGAIDWDGKNPETTSIKVLAHEERDGLENCILDPTSLVLLLQRVRPESLPKFGIPKETKFITLLEGNKEFWQPIVDAVQSLVLGVTPSSWSRAEVNYAGGLTLSLAEQYLVLDDHKLEQKVVEALPELQSIRNVPVYIADKIYNDAPDLIPNCFIELFKSILNEEA